MIKMMLAALAGLIAAKVFFGVHMGLIPIVLIVLLVGGLARFTQWQEERAYNSLISTPPEDLEPLPPKHSSAGAASR